MANDTNPLDAVVKAAAALFKKDAAIRQVEASIDRREREEAAQSAANTSGDTAPE